MWYTDAPYDSGDPGVTSVGTLEVKNLGKITVTMDPLNPIMTAGNFTVKNGGIIETDTLKVTLNATDMTIEKGGTVTGNGHGYGAEKGKGPGSRASHYSSGGGHGSAGKLYLLPEILYFLVQTQKRLVFFWKCMRDICL
jgi:hypothetical protein